MKYFNDEHRWLFYLCNIQIVITCLYFTFTEQNKTEQTKGRYKHLAINIHVNALYCLPTKPVQCTKFNSALNAASETSNGPRSMSQGLAIVN